MLYFYHLCFHVQYNCYSKNYLLSLVCNSFLLLHVRKTISLITLLSFSSLKRFLISLSILSLISSFPFFSLKRFLIPLIVVSDVSFFYFFPSKNISYIFDCVFFIKTWTFQHYMLWKKLIIFFKKDKSLLHCLKSILKF